MADSETAIANRALYLAGEDRISALNEGTPSAQVANQFFTPSLRETIYRPPIPWSCSITYQQLATGAGDNFTPFDYKYALPSDPEYLGIEAIIDFDDSSGSTPEYAEYDDESVWEVAGGFIYTDIENAGLKYRGLVSVAILDQWVVDALVRILARNIAEKVGRNSQRTRGLESNAEGQLLMSAQAEALHTRNRSARNNRRSNATGPAIRTRWDRAGGRGSGVIRDLTDAPNW